MNDIDSIAKAFTNASALVLLAIFVYQQLVYDRRKIDELVSFLMKLAAGRKPEDE